MNFATEKRLRTIDLLVDHYGTISRAVIMNMFGISPACATRDFAAYRQAAPDNLVFDSKSKTYHKAVGFRRIFS